MRATIDMVGLGDDVSFMGSRVDDHKECLQRVRDFLRSCTCWLAAPPENQFSIWKAFENANPV